MQKVDPALEAERLAAFLEIEGPRSGETDRDAYLRIAFTALDAGHDPMAAAVLLSAATGENESPGIGLMAVQIAHQNSVRRAEVTGDLYRTIPVAEALARLEARGFTVLATGHDEAGRPDTFFAHSGPIFGTIAADSASGDRTVQSGRFHVVVDEDPDQPAPHVPGSTSNFIRDAPHGIEQPIRGWIIARSYDRGGMDLMADLGPDLRDRVQSPVHPEAAYNLQYHLPRAPLDLERIGESYPPLAGVTRVLAEWRASGRQDFSGLDRTE